MFLAVNMLRKLQKSKWVVFYWPHTDKSKNTIFTYNERFLIFGPALDLCTELNFDVLPGFTVYESWLAPGPA